MSPLAWFAAVMVIVGAVMLVFGGGATVVWFGCIASGCALYVVDQTRRQTG